MKKALALILTLAMVLSMAACGGQEQTTAAPTQPQTTAAPTEAPTTKAPDTTEAPTTEAPTTEAPTTEAPTTEAPTEPETTEAPEPPAEPQVVKTLYVLNSAEGDTAVYDLLKGWNFGKFAEDNFWFDTKAEKAYIVSYSDGYAGEFDYEMLKKQIISVDTPEALQDSFPNAVIFGPDMDTNTLPWKMGTVICGPEAILFGKKKAWNAEELFNDKLGGLEDITMVEADSYDFICADGYSEEIDKENLANVEIFFNEDKTRMDATSIAYAGYSLENIKYIVPHGVDPENLPEVEDGKVYKITVFNTAAKVGYDAEAKKAFPLEDDSALFLVPDDATQEAGLAVSDLLEKLGITDVKAINVVCADGYAEEIDAEDIKDVFFFHLEDRIDATSIAYPGYTLNNAVKIEIVK